jgi:hypothetical protein
MARRKAANPPWNNKDAIGHCIRSFRNSPKRLKALTTNWKEFEIAFRRILKIKATMMSVSWLENNRQKPNESITAFVTRIQNAVATTSREAITNKANDVKEEDKTKVDRPHRKISSSTGDL